MAFYTRPELDDRQYKQLSGSTLSMIGITDFIGKLKSKGIEIDASIIGDPNQSVGKALTLLSPNKIGFGDGSDSEINGEYISKTISKTSHGLIVGDVVGYNLTSGQYVKSTLATGGTETMGIIGYIPDENSFTVVISGYFTLSNSVLTDQGIIAPNTYYYLSGINSGKLSTVNTSLSGNVSRPVLLTTNDNGDGTTGCLVFQYRSDIMYGGGGGTIGEAEDGDYTDGYYTDLVPTMRPGIPIDRFNQLFKTLLPQPAPYLTSISSTSTFSDGKLSFGPTRNDIGYMEVTTHANNSAVDINGQYLNSGTRLGIINNNVIGILNNNVVGNSNGIPYENYAFGNGDKGTIELELNGVVVNTVSLSGTSNAINNTINNTSLMLSALKTVKLENGNDVTGNYYRTGIYDINVDSMFLGFNYLKISHKIGTNVNITNYLEWVYDSNSNSILVTSNVFDSITLTGNRYLSGVKYHTGGSVFTRTVANNVYRNVYANGQGITYVNKVNLSNPTSINMEGTFTEISVSDNYPNLKTTMVNPEQSDMVVEGILPIFADKVLGTLGSVGKIGYSTKFNHALNSKSVTSSSVSETGFLLYEITQSSNFELENFNGEINRLIDSDYISNSYSDINSGLYDWDSSINLVSVNPDYNTGLMVFDGSLGYPNSSYYNSEYGISNGQFNLVTNGPLSNVNYSSASGIRNYIRLFKSNNTTTQSTLTFNITHNGNSNNFLTDGGIGGTPSGNFIKFEFMIKRANGSTHGWANPFASTGNPEGIANTSISHSGLNTTVSCTLSTTPRVSSGDIVLVRVKGASDWSNVLWELRITNI